jgi:hypothetical protein
MHPPTLLTHLRSSHLLPHSSIQRRMKQSLTPEPDPRAKQGHSSPVSELYKMASIDEDEEGHRGSMSGGVVSRVMIHCQVHVTDVVLCLAWWVAR